MSIYNFVKPPHPGPLPPGERVAYTPTPAKQTAGEPTKRMVDKPLSRGENNLPLP